MHQEAAQLGYGGEIYRKLLHVLAVGYPAGYLLLPEPWGLLALIGLSITALSLDLIRSRHAGTHAFFERYFGFMMRRKERDVLEKDPTFNGATWVTVSATLLVLLFPTDVAVVAFVTFMAGDAAAALIGRRFGRRRWLRKSATIEGSMAFLVVSGATGWVLVSGLLPWPELAISVPAVWAACFVATILEASPLPINDNVAAPLGAALVLVGMMSIWPN